jgi:hypothetical protein
LKDARRIQDEQNRVEDFHAVCEEGGRNRRTDASDAICELSFDEQAKGVG